MKSKANLIILLYVLCCLSEDKHENKEHFAIDVIEKYRLYMFDKIKDTSMYYFDNIFSKRGVQMLNKPIDINRINDLFEIINYLSFQVPIRKYLGIEPCCATANQIYTEVRSFESHLIEDEKTYHFWVELFNSNDFKISQNAYNILLNNSRSDYLAKYSSEIKSGLESFRMKMCENINTEACKKLVNNKVDYKDITVLLPGDELYMLLPLSSIEKQIMLIKIKNMPNSYNYSHYSAKLGDKGSEKDLIKQFEQADQFNSKKILAQKLGTIGTQECAEALIRSLNSPLKEMWYGGRTVSIRSSIIKALGKIHPEVSFLWVDIEFITKCGDRAYGGRENIKQYLEKVIFWAKNTYNTSPVDPPLEPVLEVDAPMISPGSNSEGKTWDFKKLDSALKKKK